MRIADDGGVLELADRLLPLLRRGAPVAVATCIDVMGSAPHGVGTSMAMVADGLVIGSVSGGCVEAAALADCRAVLQGGPALVRRYGFGAADAAPPGLACGGEVDVLTCRIDPAGPDGAALIRALERCLRGGPAAVGLVTSGPARLVGRVLSGDGGVAGVSGRGLRVAMDGALLLGRSSSVEVACGTTPLRLLVDVAATAPRLLVIGATETAVALSAAAAAVGLVVTVCDPREDFAVPARVPAAAAVVHGLPHEVLASFAPTSADAVCLLSHDEDLDPIALAVALESPAGYVGALGSRSTAARRAQRMRDLGVPAARLARLHAPIGLDIGARTPAETAVSIVAELLAVRNGVLPAPLREGAGPIHRSPALRA